MIQMCLRGRQSENRQSMLTAISAFLCTPPTVISSVNTPHAAWALVLVGNLALMAPARAQETIIVDINVVGLNQNQTIANEQLNRVCSSESLQGSDIVTTLAPICSELNQLDPNDAQDIQRIRQIGDAIAVEEAFVINDSLVVASDFQTINVRERLRVLKQAEANGTEQSASLNRWQAGTANAADASSIIANKRLVGGAASADLASPIGVFLNGHISSGDTDGADLQQDTAIDSSNLTIGSDYRFSENVVAGIGAGVLQDESRFVNVAGGAESDGLHVTAFASWFETDQGYLDVVLDFGQMDFNLDRPINLYPETPIVARSSPAARSTTLTVSAGRNFRPFDWDLGAYFRLSQTRATVDRYAESLDDSQTDLAAVFSIGKQSVNATEIVLGLELSKALSTTRAVIVPMIRLEYVTESEREKDSIIATFNTTDIVASYRGTKRDSGYTNLGLGASVVLTRGVNAYAYYESYLQHDLVSRHSVTAGVRLEF